MKIKSILFATLAAGGLAATATAMPVAPRQAGVDAQQAHSVRICDHGRCWWSDDHRHGYRGDRWGYGGGRWGHDDNWRRRDRWHRERDWDQDWRRW
jgi:hypothetical protein